MSLPDPDKPAGRERRPLPAPDREVREERDRTVTTAEKQRRFDSPKRTTLTELPPAVRPERKPTLGGWPSSPPIPPAIPAGNRRAAPPAIVSAPPTTVGPPDEDTTLQSPVGALPPVSLTPDAAAVEALRRRAETAEAKAQELERQARVRLETRGPQSFPPAVTPGPPPPVVVVQPDPKVAGMTMRQALIGLVLAMTALGAPLGIYLTAQAEAAKAAIARQQIQTTQAVQKSESTDSKARDNDKETAALRLEVQQLRVNLREVLRLQGVKVPNRPGDPDPPDMEPTVPLREDGKVKPGPTLILGKPL